MENIPSILGINTLFQENNDVQKQKNDLKKIIFEDSFDSTISYLDYDVVLIDTRYISQPYIERHQSNYVRSDYELNDKEVRQLKDDFIGVRTKITDFCRNGKNIYVLLGNNEKIYEQTYKGPVEIDINSFLPFQIKLVPNQGLKMDMSNKPEFKEFFRTCGTIFEYDVTIEMIGNNYEIIGVVEGTDVIVSAMCNYLNGKIIFLPNIYHNSFSSNIEQFNSISNFLSNITILNNKLLKNQKKQVLPQWLDNLNILDSLSLINKKSEHIQSINEYQKKIDDIDLTLNLYDDYKRLLVESGIQLENLCKKALLDLGFTFDVTKKNRTDIIAKYSDINIVIEVKGVTKSAAEKHAVQLEKWVSEYYEANEVFPKGILIVNGFCDTPLSKRSVDVFPNQMLDYSIKRNFCLLSTVQFLCLLIDTKFNPGMKDDIVREMLSTVGIYNKYPTYSDFLK